MFTDCLVYTVSKYNRRNDQIGLFSNNDLYNKCYILNVRYMYLLLYSENVPVYDAEMKLYLVMLLILKKNMLSQCTIKVWLYSF